MRRPEGARNDAVTSENPQPVAGIVPPAATFTAPRGDRGELRVQLREYNGTRFVDVRVWTQGPDGAWYPTGKGTSLRLRELGGIIRTLADIARATGTDSHRTNEGG